ncbi:hypothetical protein SUGI_0678820 [Cryptomeria japonica]|nr:hypothetical protein SUGI_0678820 [Cryptomeria japonica]
MVFRPFFWVTCEKRRNSESSLKYSQTVVGGERVKMRRNSANREHVGGERVKKRRKWKTWCLKKAAGGGDGQWHCEGGAEEIAGLCSCEYPANGGRHGVFYMEIRR